MLVFSTEKFIESEGEKTYQSCKKWLDIVEGSEVRFPRDSHNGFSINGCYFIDRKWTVDEKDYEPYRPKKKRK